VDDQQRKLLSVLDTCWPSLHGLLVRLTLRPDAAEDLFQDLFVRLSHAEGFHRTADPAGYAHRAAINLAMDWRRARRRKTEARPLRFDLPAQEPPRAGADDPARGAGAAPGRPGGPERRIA